MMCMHRAKQLPMIISLLHRIHRAHFRDMGRWEMRGLILVGIRIMCSYVTVWSGHVAMESRISRIKERSYRKTRRSVFHCGARRAKRQSWKRRKSSGHISCIRTRRREIRREKRPSGRGLTLSSVGLVWRRIVLPWSRVRRLDVGSHAFGRTILHSRLSALS